MSTAAPRAPRAAPPAAAARELVSQAEYARRRRVTRNAVHAAVKTERIRLVEGLVDVAQADRDWTENTDDVKARGRGRDADSNQSLRQERIRGEQLSNQRAEIALLKDLEQLTHLPSYDQVNYDRLRKGVKMLQGLDARLGPEVAGLTDVLECKKAIRREVDLVITAIAKLADGSDPRKRGA